MSDVAGIYLLRNTVSGRVYVGQSVHIRRRWNEHRASANRGDKSRLYDAMRRYGVDAFQLVVLEECGPALFDERELYWMDRLSARVDGYNLMPAGQNGRVADAAMRELIAGKLRGRKLSPSHVENIRQGQIGRKHTDETKAKIGAGNRKPKSAEAALKTAAGLRRYFERLTPEQRAEHASKRSGWFHTDALKQAVSARFIGVKKSPEQIERMKAAARNRSPEAEARRIAALRDAMARKRQANPQ